MEIIEFMNKNHNLFMMMKGDSHWIPTYLKVNFLGNFVELNLSLKNHSSLLGEEKIASFNFSEWKYYWIMDFGEFILLYHLLESLNNVGFGVIRMGIYQKALLKYARILITIIMIHPTTCHDWLRVILWVITWGTESWLFFVWLRLSPNNTLQLTISR